MCAGHTGEGALTGELGVGTEGESAHIAGRLSVRSGGLYWHGIQSLASEGVYGGGGEGGTPRKGREFRDHGVRL